MDKRVQALSRMWERRGGQADAGDAYGQKAGTWTWAAAARYGGMGTACGYGLKYDLMED